MKKRLIIILGIAISTIVILFLLKEVISKQIYMRQVNELAEKVPTDKPINYREDLLYTMKKFWASYKQEIITQNDLNEVMDHVKALNRKETVSGAEIFNFINYVSDIYTTATIELNLERSSE